MTSVPRGGRNERNVALCGVGCPISFQKQGLSVNLCVTNRHSLARGKVIDQIFSCIRSFSSSVVVLCCQKDEIREENPKKQQPRAVKNPEIMNAKKNWEF